MSIGSQMEYNTGLSVDVAGQRMRANKIICTIGPASQSVEKLRALVEAGMDVARLNFSHGSYEYHQGTINNIREATAHMPCSVCIALDTKGPEIRTGNFREPTVTVTTGSKVFVTTDPQWIEKGTAERFYVDYKSIVETMEIGNHVFIDDGLLDLQVEDKVNGELQCKALNSHTLSNRRGVNLPKTKIDLPGVSEKDRADLLFGVKQGVDCIFASFIRSAKHVQEVREVLGKEGEHVQIIAKIENHEGVHNVDEIIAAADGIMVARGDLGVEIPAEKVVVAQKMIISKCNIAGKPVICATQMLESMTSNPRPTRAEVSDVANAVLDGADCVMLSGETAKGQYPVEAVQYMARVCIEAQSSTWHDSMYLQILNLQGEKKRSPEEAVCAASVAMSSEIGAKAIVVLTNSGKSAKLVAKYRPAVPIFAATQIKWVFRLLATTYAAIPVYYDTDVLGPDLDRERRVAHAVQAAKDKNVLKKGDLVVVVHADHRTKGFANQTRVIPVE